MEPIFKYDIGYIIHGKYSDSEIIDRYIAPGKYPSIAHKNYKTYLCKCQRDGNVFEFLENDVNKNKNCPICGRLKWEQNQTIECLHPEVIKYLSNPEDAKIYRSQSSKKVLCICPECGYLKEVTISNLCNKGFSCNCCGDGISYPNKFIHCLLNQLNTEHISEMVFSWSDGKKYDQYITNMNMIIENHGMQHYSDRHNFSDSCLTDVKNNDLYKYNLALNNGIKYYVTLDCRYSDVEYIKKSVMSSILPELFNFQECDIDWSQCDVIASSSLKAKVWNEWSINQNIKNLIDKFGLSKTTLRDYIRQGYKNGKCPDYIKQYNGLIDVGNHHNKGCSKPIYCVTDNIYFATRFDCENYYKDFFPEKTGSSDLYIFINRDKTYKGKKFIYITQEEFNVCKAKSLVDSSIIAIGDFYYNEYVS